MNGKRKKTTRAYVLSKGDIALLSLTPGGSTRRVVCPGGCIWDPLFWVGEIVGGQRIVPFERAMVVSYRLSIGIALSLTIRPQFAIVSVSSAI